MSEPYDNGTIYKKLIEKTSDMAAVKGFSYIGITKLSCTTMIVGGMPRSTVCRAIAKMLHDGETAESHGKQKVRYDKVEDVRRGVMALPVES